MIKQFIVHIGDHKTGTTSIQATLAHSGLRTAPQRIKYATDRSHNGLALAFMNNRRSKNTAQRFARLRDVFMAADQEIGVMSAEAFESCTPTQMDDMLRTYFPEFADTARVICYVRPHAQRVLSSFAEQTKNGDYSGDLRAFHHRTFDRKRFVYTTRFDAWRAQFGDRFTVKPMIRGLLEDGDVIKDFLREVLGPEGTFTLPEGMGMNASLSLEELALLRLLQSKIGVDARPTRQPMGWQLQTILAQLPVESGPKTKVMLDADLAKDIYDAYAADAKALDAGFFDGTPIYDSLVKDVAKAVPTPQSVLAEDHFSPQTLRRLTAMAEALATMLSFEPRAMHGHLRNKTTEAFLASDPKYSAKGRQART